MFISIESAKAYIERLKTDEGFREKVKAADDQEARMALVKAEGFDFTPDEIAEIDGKLSDDELDIAGGSAMCGEKRKREGMEWYMD